MNAKRTDNLEPLSDAQQRLVRFARLAVRDTIHGGAAALAQARNAVDREDRYVLEGIVTDVYQASSGKVPDHLDAFECNECGCVHLGKEAADVCCSPEEDDGVDLFGDDDDEESDEDDDQEDDA